VGGGRSAARSAARLRSTSPGQAHDQPRHRRGPTSPARKLRLAPHSRKVGQPVTTQRDRNHQIEHDRRRITPRPVRPPRPELPNQRPVQPDRTCCRDQQRPPADDSNDSLPATTGSPPGPRLRFTHGVPLSSLVLSLRKHHNPKQSWHSRTFRARVEPRSHEGFEAHWSCAPPDS